LYLFYIFNDQLIFTEISLKEFLISLKFWEGHQPSPIINLLLTSQFNLFITSYTPISSAMAACHVSISAPIALKSFLIELFVAS